MDAQDGGGLPDTEAETSLRLASVEALRWLQQAKDGDGQLLMKQAPSSSASLDSGPPHEARDPDHDALEADSHLVVDTSIDFSTLPTPNRLLQATLRRALAESQASRASSPSTPIRPVLRKSSVLPIDVGVQRWALSSLLHHYLGEDFGQMRKDDGVTSYARDERDDLAIRELFPDPRRFSVVEGEGIPSSPSTASVAHAQQAGVPALQAELRRDDKLKWLLGETVASQTVRRTSPLPGPLASSSQSKPRTRKNRMVARSPTASEPRRRIFNHQNWLSEADSQEMVHARTRTSSASSEPLSPPHRRAWSADSDLSSLKLHGTYIQDRDNDSNKNRAYARQSFDTTSSNAEWRGGVSLSRIDSYETYNSQSHLIRPGHDVNEALERFPALSRTFGDTLLEHPTKALPMSGLLDTPQSSRPFTNLSAVGPWYDSMQPLNSSSAAKGLPSTSNELSAREKQHLIRKGRKLKAILGTEVQEESVDRGVQVSRSEARNIDTLSKRDKRARSCLALSHS